MLSSNGMGYFKHQGLVHSSEGSQLYVWKSFSVTYTALGKKNDLLSWEKG